MKCYQFWKYLIWSFFIEMLSILEICYFGHLDVIYVNLPAKMLLNIDTAWAFIKIVSIPDEEYFSETAVGCTATYFVKILECSRWLCKPPPPRRRMVSARYR